MKTFPFLLLFTLTLASVAHGAVSAEEMQEARERIVDRLPETENLWNRGLTGENNEGYVTARSSLNSEQIRLVQAENRDRLLLYTYIASKTGSSHIQIGRIRAEEVAKMAKNGLWIQEPAGNWARK